MCACITSPTLQGAPRRALAHPLGLSRTKKTKRPLLRAQAQASAVGQLPTSSRWTVFGENAGRHTAMYSAPSGSGVA